MQGGWVVLGALRGSPLRLWLPRLGLPQLFTSPLLFPPRAGKEGGLYGGRVARAAAPRVPPAPIPRWQLRAPQFGSNMENPERKQEEEMGHGAVSRLPSPLRTPDKQPAAAAPTPARLPALDPASSPPAGASSFPATVLGPGTLHL